MAIHSLFLSKPKPNVENPSSIDSISGSNFPWLNQWIILPIKIKKHTNYQKMGMLNDIYIEENGGWKIFFKE